MYNIIRDKKITELLNEFPNKNKNVKMEDILEMRKIIGQGCAFCKRFIEKCNTVEEAVILYHNIMQKVC